MRELCPWYALSVKHQHEQPVRAALEYKGFEALVPTYRARKHWSDRTKELNLPLFAGYVFCRFSLDQRITILDTPSVSRLVGFGGSPMPVAAEEIAALQKAMSAGAPMRPWPQMQPGDRVRVERGPLRGIEGQLVKDDGGFQLLISVELLQRRVAVRVEADVVVPLGPTHTFTQAVFASRA